MRAPSAFGRVRELLRELLPTDADLEAFCLDYFPRTKQRFGGGMERLQKEDLLLSQERPEDVVVALRTARPDATIWRDWPGLGTPAHGPLCRRRWLRPGVTIGLLLALLAGGLLLSGRNKTDCPPLAIDAVFVGRRGRQPVLDVRVRNPAAQPLSLNRAALDLSHRTEFDDRSPLDPSTEYDLRIAAAHSEGPLAQKLSPAEIDRFFVRLAATQAMAGAVYEARLRVEYNGTCRAESVPFELVLDAALEQ